MWEPEYGAAQPRHVPTWGNQAEAVHDPAVQGHTLPCESPTIHTITCGHYGCPEQPLNNCRWVWDEQQPCHRRTIVWHAMAVNLTLHVPSYKLKPGPMPDYPSPCAAPSPCLCACQTLLSSVRHSLGIGIQSMYEHDRSPPGPAPSGTSPPPPPPVPSNTVCIMQGPSPSRCSPGSA